MLYVLDYFHKLSWRTEARLYRYSYLYKNIYEKHWLLFEHIFTIINKYIIRAINFKKRRNNK